MKLQHPLMAALIAAGTLILSLSAPRTIAATRYVWQESPGPADGFRFPIRGEPGKSVIIERSRDLVHWEFAGRVPIPANGQTLIDPAASTEPQWFYCVISIP